MKNFNDLLKMQKEAASVKQEKSPEEIKQQALDETKSGIISALVKLVFSIAAIFGEALVIFILARAVFATYPFGYLQTLGIMLIVRLTLGSIKK